MSNLFVCYPHCSTCKRAKDWLDTNGIEYDTRDIKTQNPTEDELKNWIGKSNLPVRRFFNTSGMLYRALSLASRLDDMSDDEKISLLASDGMLVKRPILLAGSYVLVGFKPDEWERTFGLKAQG